jgi:hypothetical protein
MWLILKHKKEILRQWNIECSSCYSYAYEYHHHEEKKKDYNLRLRSAAAHPKK